MNESIKQLIIKLMDLDEDMMVTDWQFTRPSYVESEFPQQNRLETLHIDVNLVRRN